MLAGLELMALAGTVVDTAAETGLPSRSLDALHLAWAKVLGTELSTFVAYDQRLLSAAQASRLPVASPGRDAS